MNQELIPTYGLIVILEDLIAIIFVNTDFGINEYDMEEVDSGDNNEEEVVEEETNDVEAVKQARVQKIKKREKTAIAIAKNAEKLKRAKSNIQTARLRIKGAQSPESKAKAREGLRGARRHLATTGMKAGTAQK